MYLSRCRLSVSDQLSKDPSLVYDPKLSFFKDSCFSQEAIDAIELMSYLT